MKSTNVVALLIFALALAVQAPLASAQQIEDEPLELSFDQRLILAQGEKLTPSEAAKKAQQQHGGKVVGSPRCRDTESGTICTVKLDIDGRIKTVTVRG